MAKYVFGIDLGTTYSCIAYVDETGRATVVNNSEGTNTTPSVVNFASPSQVVVGQVAKENAVIDPDNTISLVKTLMGKTDFAISYNGEDKSPEEVSAYILRKVAEDAAKMLDTEVKDVVITCPAYFGTAERTATKNAGIIAGLNVLEVISEPTAAALYYGCAREQEEKTILVFDLGGGTFDVTIMNISSEKIEVICSDGNHELGGKDWDEAVMRYLAEEFISQTGFDGEFDEYAQQDMRLKAEKAKQQLTSRDQVPVMLDAAGLRARINLTREKFDEITSALLGEAIEKTESAIDVAKEKGYNIDEILLVGGSTRMPQVTKAIVDRFGMEPKILDPDEAVAKGAAIHAVNVYVNNQKSLEPGDVGETTVNVGGATKEINADDYKEELAVQPEMMSIGGKTRQVVVATTKSFAIEVLINGESKCCNMIIKNEPMPNGSISVTKEFGTNVANQESAELVVYESDFMEETFDVDKDFVLGTATLELSENLPVGSPIQVTFTLSTEGILEVSGVDKTTGREVHATMQAKGIMAEEKVDELKEKSKQMVVM
ncbi:Hsp70 family protein [Coprococcus comes]|uniref:Chaperone protein DnaK n=1 Tax=Coprococcus comes TaxID=410072 RepID=A0A3R6HD45_9FIRM|nr:Hsp70 family protein [Coprococcus comes]RHG62312.1 Hsp70 family protein [Coprococcus comes]